VKRILVVTVARLADETVAANDDIGFEGVALAVGSTSSWAGPFICRCVAGIERGVSGILELNMVVRDS
jgi:hypothetical protein